MDRKQRTARVTLWVNRGVAVLLAVIMAFLCLVVSVVASVMDAAVTIREENDHFSSHRTFSTV